MHSLNNVQKFLITAALIIFFIITILSFVAAIPTFKITAIRDLFFASPIVAQTDNSTSKYLYGENLNLTGNNIQVQFNHNTLISDQPINLKIASEDQLSISDATIYIDATNSFTMANGKIKITIAKGVKAIYSSADKTFVVLAGQEQFQTSVAKANQYAILQVDKFIVKDFDRSKFNTSAYSSVISSIKYFNQLPTELTKTSPPVLYSLEPSIGFKTSDPSITLKGKVDPGTQVKFNNNQIHVDSNGNFSEQLTLNIGNNQVVLDLSDQFGNKQNVSAIYIRTNDIQTCNFTTFDAQLACLLNTYRKNKSANNLAYSTPLENVAYKHSLWMATNNDLSHIESDNSSYKDRCITGNTECQFEIIIKVQDNNASNAAKQLENSQDYNVYLKDQQYKSIGIGLYNNYLTILLN